MTRTARAYSVSVGLPERPERRAELLGEEPRLFPGREVTTLVDLVEVDEIAIGAPGPGLRGSIDLLRKHRDGHRERDLGGLLRGREKNALAGGLPVQPRRGGGLFVNQYSVMSSSTSSLSISGARARRCCSLDARASTPQAPLGESVKAVADRLRPRAHHRAVGPVLLVERARVIECLTFLLGEARRCGPAAGERRGDLGRHRRRQIDMDAEQTAGAWRAIALETGEPQSPPWAT